MNMKPVALCLSLLIFLVTGCSDKPAAETPQAPKIEGSRLRFAANHPQLASLSATVALPVDGISVDLPAKLIWNEERTQRIYPAFAGRVTAIRADVGQQVRVGSALALLASPEFGQAQADAAKSSAEERRTQRNLERQRELFEVGIVSRKDLEQAESEAAQSRAEAARAAGKINLYGSSGAVNQQLAISSTISGMVVERNLNPGQELRPDQSGPGMPPAFVVSDPSTLWVQIDARESEADALAIGTPFQLLVPSLPKALDITGKVVAVSDFIDPTTRSIKVRGLVKNPDKILKAEMLASARIERQMEGGTLIPASAIFQKDGKHFAFVQTDAQSFERREIELSYEGPKQIVVSAGVAVGEKVVVENVLLLARLFQLSTEAQKVAADKK